MTRPITVSTDVFAGIWAKRKSGEDTEDVILRRILNCPPSPKKRISEPEISEIGFKDNRNGVLFKKGFEIFRHYKGKKYSATAVNNSWLRQDNNSLFYSINQLNESIAAGNENVWNGNWKYKDKNGFVHSIDRLRK